MNNKLLVICGPTATGKTSLALSLAKKYNGELVSADSRQVYKSLDIGTGKDIPKNLKFCISNLAFMDFEVGFYTDGKIRLWGYDLVEPTEQFSVSQYVEIANKIIEDIWSRGKLPILVGGTGLYIRGIVDGIETVHIPRNEELRNSLEKKLPDELYELLSSIDPFKTASMNSSDRKNPRRLVRAIEVALHKPKFQNSNDKLQTKIEKNVLFVGLKADKELIKDRIEKNVQKRLSQGFEDEIKNLSDSGVTLKMQSMNTLGYKHLRKYLNKEISRELAIRQWISDENKYAKRQMTWFRKNERIKWFNITVPNFEKEVEKLLGKWNNEIIQKSSHE